MQLFIMKHNPHSENKLTYNSKNPRTSTFNISDPIKIPLNEFHVYRQSISRDNLSCSFVPYKLILLNQNLLLSNLLFCLFQSLWIRRLVLVFVVKWTLRIVSLFNRFLSFLLYFMFLSFLKTILFAFSFICAFLISNFLFWLSGRGIWIQHKLIFVFAKVV